ncbi:MAG: HEAT repeat domain-containing protein [Candidatus Acidiferrales bacterium]
MSENFENEKVEHGRTEIAAPIDGQPRRVSHGMRLAIASSALVLALAFFLTLKPTPARAVWEEFARIIELKGELKNGAPAASRLEYSKHLNERLADLGAQKQAELLVEAMLNDYDGATEQLSSRMDGWRGQLTMSPRLKSLLDAALNSNDLRVRAAAIEMELVAYDLPKTHESADVLIDRIESDPAGRSWALWMLGATGNRGIEPERSAGVLSKYAHDPDEKTRYWAVEGLSLLGSDAAIQPLLEVFRNDPSLQVRERAGCGLAHSGMLTREQRFAAVPTLMKYGEDPSLDSNTRDWVYQALREITGARYGTNSTDWREWWAENTPR